MSLAKVESSSQEGGMMEKETASTMKSEPIVIEQAGMRMTVAHRQGLGGSDEGLTFDVTTPGPE